MSRRRSGYGLPVGPTPLPVVEGDAAFRRDPLGFLVRLHSVYGPTVAVYLRDAPVFFFARLETIRSILLGQSHNFTTHGFTPEQREFFGDSLITTDGDFHRQQRRLVRPAFHTPRIQRYHDLMVAETAVMLAQWRRTKRLDLHADTERLTLRTAVQAIFSTPTAESDEVLRAFDGAVNITRARPYALLRDLTLRSQLPFMPYGRYQRARRHLAAVVDNLVTQHRVAGTDNGDMCSALLHARGRDGARLTARQIHDHVLNFIGATQQTTSRVLIAALTLLARHPESRSKLLAELQTVLAGRSPAVEEVEHLASLDMVIKEVLRLDPPFITEGRQALDSFDAEGYTFPAGSKVMINRWAVHHASAYFSEPERFRPERFDPTIGEARPTAYFPFSIGAHACIGQSFALLQLRVALAMILQQFLPVLTVEGQLKLSPRETRLSTG
jgi:cytochrome P450